MLKKLLVLSTLTVGSVVHAEEVSIGDPIIKNGMEVAVVYLKPQAMDIHQGDLSNSDIHLEADIHATDDNENGFSKGDWIPHLTVSYKIEKVDSGKVENGVLIPMVASDGPHYGKNIKLQGKGQYKLTLTLKAPGSNEAIPLARHTSKENGVEPWFDTFQVQHTFDFSGNRP